MNYELTIDETINHDVTKVSNVTVHAGQFHADDVAAVALLQIGNPDITYNRIFRVDGYNVDSTEGNIVADIGGGIFDHHQKNVKTRLDGLKECAATLVWQCYGYSIVREVFPGIEGGIVDYIVNKLDTSILAYISAVDNGQLNHTVSMKNETDVEYVNPFAPKNENNVAVNLFPYQLFDISAAISAMNVTWNETQADQDQQFEFAVQHIMKPILRRKLQLIKSSYECINIVSEALEKSENGIVVLDRFAPWQDIVCEDKNAKCVVFYSNRNTWTVQLVPEVPNSFNTRVQVPETWKGKKDDDAREVFHGLNFCHNSGFISSYDSKEDALAAAKYIIEYNK